MPDLSTALSRNFRLRELVSSAVAERDPGLRLEQESPPAEVVDSLRYLVERTLQPIRDRIGIPIRVTSGYRCQRVNALVHGSASSQHCLGEAADCQLAPTFLDDPATLPFRRSVMDDVMRITGRGLRLDVNESFYLFAFACIHLDELDIDQVIHEYGSGFGRPAWVHLSASRRRNARDIRFVGPYTGGSYLRCDVKQALEYGTDLAPVRNR